MADLLIGEIQPHEVEAEDPDPQWLVMTGEDGPGQVVEVLPTDLATVAATFELARIVTLLGDPRGVAMGTGDALWPA
jgi:hypothetical protein